MKMKLLLAAMALQVISFRALGCDVCGCSINGFGAGLLAVYRSNTVGIRAFNVPYIQDLTFEVPVEDEFQKVEFYFRYHLFKQKWIVTGNLPYVHNVRLDGPTTTILNGLGDIRANLHYALLDNIPAGKNAFLYWEIGTGIKLATGTYDKQIHQRELPENFNIGNGSLGYTLQSNAVYNRGKLGWVWNANYQFNAKTSDGYHFGNQWTTSSLVFYRLGVGAIHEVIPYIGVLFEKTEKDKDFYNVSAHGTGGKGLFFNSGINYKFMPFMVGASVSFPLSQKFALGEMKARPRLAIDFTFNF